MTATATVPPPHRRWPVFGSLAGYDRSWLRSDAVAGLTVWAVLVPEALAYASIAGVSPVVGLYAAPPALVLYAAFGSSRHLVVGPMSATAALSAAAVADLTTGGPGDVLAFTGVLAIMTGVLALLAGLLRLGFLANFISEPVLKGFIIGLALTIIIAQVPKLFGIPTTEGDFFEQLGGVIRHLGDTQGRTLAVGALSLTVVLTLRRWLPIVPGSLVAVILGVVAVKLFDLDAKGVAIVGPIDSGLPSLGLPDGRSFSDYLTAAAAAGGIMLVGFAEGLGAAKTYATRAHYDVDANRELIGLGAANLGAGLSTGMVVNGSLSKTRLREVFEEPGEEQQRDDRQHGDDEPGHLRSCDRASKPHVAELGRVVGRPDQFSDIERHPDNERDPAVGVLRVEAGLFFANAEAVRAAIRARAAEPGTVGVVLDAEAVAFVDITAVRMLDELAEDLAREGRRLVIAHDIGQVGDLLAEGASALGVYPTIDDAMAAARAGAPGGEG